MRSLVVLFFYFLPLAISAQETFSLGAGGGIVWNKTPVGNLDSYKLPEKNAVWVITAAFEPKKHFMLLLPVQYSQQNIPFSTFHRGGYGINTIPGSYNVSKSYAFSSIYRYIGFSILPAITLGKKHKFYMGAGPNIDDCLNSRNRIAVRESRWHIDSTGMPVTDQVKEYDSLSPVQKKGFDLAFIFQAGARLRMSEFFSLQPCIIFRWCRNPGSIQPDKYSVKRDLGFNLSLVWHIAEAKKRKG
jgi:hypothetical protein